MVNLWSVGWLSVVLGIFFYPLKTQAREFSSDYILMQLVYLLGVAQRIILAL